MASATAFFSSRVHRFRLVKSCALSAASFCVKWTTYTGALASETSFSSVWASGICEYAYSSGTGRSTDFTTAVARPLRRVSASSKNVTSPRVADISRKRAWGRASRRHLPGHAAVAVGVPVELVHDHVVHVRPVSVAERDVGQDLRRAAEDGRIAIDGGIPGGQAHVLRPQLAAEGHPLLVDERLDRRGVDGPAVVGQRREVQRGGHQRLARARRRVQDDVLALEQLEDRLLLGRIELQPLAGDVVEEAAEQLVAARVGVVRRRQYRVEGAGHGQRAHSPQVRIRKGTLRGASQAATAS
jgi:hypothetical protein